jgi:two-component system osmolarity sensor histidine kinase EnvZ
MAKRRPGWDEADRSAATRPVGSLPVLSPDALRQTSSTRRDYGAGKYVLPYSAVSICMKRNIAIVVVLLTGFLVLGALSFVLMQRHWDLVARRLSESMARDIAAIVDLYEASSSKDDIGRVVDIGLTRFGLSMGVLPAGNLPPPRPKPFFDLLDGALADEIRSNIKRPFWIDTVGMSRELEVRIKLDHAILRFVAPRRQAYLSNSHIFLIWMLGTSAMLLAVGYLVLRPPGTT